MSLLFLTILILFKLKIEFDSDLYKYIMNTNYYKYCKSQRSYIL